MEVWEEGQEVREREMARRARKEGDEVKERGDRDEESRLSS